MKDVSKRLGNGVDGYKHIKSHPFFSGIDWEKEEYLPLNYLIKNIKASNQVQSSICGMM